MSILTAIASDTTLNAAFIWRNVALPLMLLETHTLAPAKYNRLALFGSSVIYGMKLLPLSGILDRVAI